MRDVTELFDKVLRLLGNATGHDPTGGGDQRTLRCPAHDDRNPSLSVSIGRDRDRVVMNCHAGCPLESILETIGLLPTDLFLPKFKPPAGSGRTTGAYSYAYHDPEGEHVGTVHRRAGKRFSQQRADGAWSGFGAHLYQLPALREGIENGHVVWVVEGEKDVDRLRGLGLTATCNLGGAGKWRADFGQHFAGAEVVVIPDNDEPGRNHAEEIARSLAGIAASVRIVALPGLPPKGDVSDWLDAGHAVDELENLAANQPCDPRPAAPSEPSAWEPSDLAPIVGGTSRRPLPTELVRDDGVALLYPGKTNMLFGESESGKSWIAMHACQQALERGDRVAYIDFEQDVTDVVHRMLALGVDRRCLLDRFIYLNPDVPLGEGSRGQLLAELGDCAIVVIDGITDAMGLHGLDPNSNADYARFDRLLPRAVAALGPAVLMIDHVPKSTHEARFAVGAQHKRASIQGASYNVRVTNPLAPGTTGSIQLTIAKDRLGGVREHHKKLAGTFVMDSRNDSAICMVLAPTPVRGGASAKSDADLHERICDVLQATGPLNTNQLLKRVSGRRETVIAAAKELVDRRILSCDRGKRGSQIYRLPDASDQAREDDLSTTSPHGSDPFPAGWEQSGTDSGKDHPLGSPIPPSYGGIGERAPKPDPSKTWTMLDETRGVA